MVSPFNSHLRGVYRLPLRATQGFLTSLLQLMDIPAEEPSLQHLLPPPAGPGVVIGRTASAGARHLVADATGLQVFGEGEWKVRQHGDGRRHTGRKLHVAVDEATHEIVATLATPNAVGDGEVLPALLDQVAEPIEQVSADGSYDARACHEAIAQC